MARYYLPKGLTYNLISPDYPSANLAALKSALLVGINAEPDWGDDSAAGPLIRWFEYSHGSVGAGKAWALATASDLVPGRPSPFFEALDNAIQDGAQLVRGSGASTTLAYIDGNIDEEWQDPGRMSLVVLAGGDVEGVPVYFPFADPDAVCPVGDGVETWRQWKQGAPNTEPIQIGETWYRSSCDYARTSDSGKPINASEWVAYYLGGGSVISVSAYKELVPPPEMPI